MTVQMEPVATERTPLPPPGQKRRLELHRRRAIISSERIDVRPSREAIVPPLAGFLIGLACVVLIVWGVTADAVPYWLLAFLLLIALIAVPFAGLTLVYAVAGANVIFDARKQSGTWQQGMLGMGIGTTDLVPFWKIEAVIITEAGLPGGSAGRRTEELAQWEVMLLKKSGNRLRVAGMTVPRQFAAAGLVPVRELADAIAALTGVAVLLEATPPPEPEPDAPGVAAAAPAGGRRRQSSRPPRLAPSRQRTRRSG